MITLYKFVSAWGLPDLSAFCLKTETYLRMKGLEFKTVTGDATKAPKGKLPRVEHNGESICDSSMIIDYFENASADRMDDALDPRQRAISNAVKAMLEDQLYFVLLWQRYVPNEGAEIYRPVIDEVSRKLVYPKFVRGMIFWFLRSKFRIHLWGQGIGRHEPDEIISIGARNIESVAALLGENKYFHGDAPTTVDAVVYGFLAQVLWSPFEGRIKETMLKQQNLVSYCKRVRSRFYADDAQQIAAADV